MERVIFIEQLDRRGRVRERTRVDAFPATIGRAYSNHVIVNDRYVSPIHAHVRELEDGSLVVEDSGSVNGIRRPGRFEVEASVPFESGLQLRIGETVLRFVASDHLVAPAEILPGNVSGVLETVRAPRAALLLLAITLATFVSDIYLETYYDLSWSTILGSAIGGIVILLVWAGIWSFANRLTTHRFDFFGHLGVACLASIGSMCLWPVSEYAEFFFSSKTLAMILIVSTQASILALLLYAHLSILPASSPRRRRGWALGATALVFGLTGLLTYADPDDFSSELDITVPLKSIGAELAPAITTDEFLIRSRKTKDWVDAVVHESRD